MLANDVSNERLARINTLRRNISTESLPRTTTKTPKNQDLQVIMDPPQSKLSLPSLQKVLVLKPNPLENLSAIDDTPILQKNRYQNIESIKNRMRS